MCTYIVDIRLMYHSVVRPSMQTISIQKKWEDRAYSKRQRRRLRSKSTLMLDFGGMNENMISKNDYYYYSSL